jgi:hypothetical protein
MELNQRPFLRLQMFDPYGVEVRLHLKLIERLEKAP